MAQGQAFGEQHTARVIATLALAIALLAAVPVATASEAPPADKTAEPSLPEYNYPYHNGFYATIVGFNSVKNIKLPLLQQFPIEVEGFHCSVSARGIFQPGPAPLVIVLLGAEGRVIDPLAKRWIAAIAERGCHVLAFNSTLQKDFVSICGRGPSGNIEGEAECVRDIIAAALKSPCLSGRVTQLGVVGMSYGGIEALLLGRMAAENKLPFKIDAIQAYSPPIDLMRSVDLIDRWWREDRWKFTLPEIYFALSKHKPVEPGCCIPHSDSLMRAGIAASFRLDLADIVEANDEQYGLNILPRASNADERIRRHDFAATWGFIRFMRTVSYPYYKEKLKLNDFSELNAGAKLCNLIDKVPKFTEIIIADDDPLNTQEDLAALKNCHTLAKLTILPGGGHIGYTQEPWTQANLAALFSR